MNPGNRCGRFSLSAARRPDEQSAKSKAPSAKPMTFFVRVCSPFLPFALCAMRFALFTESLYSPAQGIRMEVSDQFVLFPRPLRERARVRGSKNYAHPHLNPLPSKGEEVEIPANTSTHCHKYRWVLSHQPIQPRAVVPENLFAAFLRHAVHLQKLLDRMRESPSRRADSPSRKRSCHRR